MEHPGGLSPIESHGSTRHWMLRGPFATDAVEPCMQIANGRIKTYVCAYVIFLRDVTFVEED